MRCEGGIVDFFVQVASGRRQLWKPEVGRSRPVPGRMRRNMGVLCDWHLSSLYMQVLA